MKLKERLQERLTPGTFNSTRFCFKKVERAEPFLNDSTDDFLTAFPGYRKNGGKGKSLRKK